MTESMLVASPVRLGAPLVVGIGNDLRGDDAVGLEVARHVREMAGDELDVLETGGDVGQLLEAWSERSLVILVDAVQARRRGNGRSLRFEP